MQHGADLPLIRVMDGFDSRLRYVMETADQLLVSQLTAAYSYYHHTVREFGGTITEADELKTPILYIVDEERYGKLSAYAYGMSCSICGTQLYSKDRTKLANKGEVRTLCPLHLEKVSELRILLSDVHRKVDRAIKDEIKDQTRSLRYEYLREKRGPKPPPPPKKVRYSGPSRRGYVYRMFNANQKLLYVGKTWNVDARLYGTNGHADTKDWWNEVKFVGVEEYTTEVAALKAEAHIIHKEKPRYNVAKPSVPATRKPTPLSRTLRVLENGKTAKVLQ
jgi:predicted GIY-YIG superfamily endonuclease